MEAREITNAMIGESGVDESYSAQCVEKWSPLVEDIKDSYMKGATAILLENEMDHLKKLTEASTSSANAGEYTKFIFPVIRSVFPNLIASQICSVQPMSAPVGAIFTMKYKDASGNALGNFDSTFDKDYSLSEVAVAGEAVITAVAAATDVVHTVATPGAGLVQGSIKVYDVTGLGTYTDDGNGNMLWTDGSGHDDSVFGTVNYQTGQVVINAGVWTNTEAVKIDYKYLREANASDVTDVTVDIEMQEVRAISRKLKALWSSEAADDLRAYHGFDAESELVAGVSSEIALEVDRERVTAIEAEATAATTKDLTAWGDTPTSYGFGHAEFIRGHLQDIGAISQKIYKDTMRAPANWMVIGTNTASYLDQLPEFVPVAEPTTNTLGIMKAGKLSGKWTVYTDPHRPVVSSTGETAIVGYKGASFMDAGYVYAPYVPLQVTPTFLDPATFEFKKGMRTRYAKKLVNSSYYGKIVFTVI